MGWNFFFKIKKNMRRFNEQKSLEGEKIRKRIIFPLVLIGTIAYTHCYFTRLDLKKMGPLQICFSIFPGIHRNSKWKEFFYSCEGFLMATITGHGHPIPLWKYAKMARVNPCMKFGIFWDQMPSFEVPAILWFYPKFVSGSVQVQVLIQVDISGLVYFCLGFLYIPRKTG